MCCMYMAHDYFNSLVAHKNMIHVVGVPNPDLVESTIRTYMHNIVTFSSLVPRLLPMPKSGESLGTRLTFPQKKQHEPEGCMLFWGM